MRKLIFVIGLAALTMQYSDGAPGTHSVPISFNYFIAGTYHADDGSLYYIRQIGNEIWWAGMSVESTNGYLDFFKGIRFTNLFHGFISGNYVSGDWVDTPRGGNLGSGTLAFTVNPGNPMTLQKVSQTGGFGPSSWSNATLATPPTACSGAPGPRCEFGHVYKNDASSLLLRWLIPEKDYVVAYGRVIGRDPGPLRVSYHADRIGTDFPPTYANFLRMHAEDPDADADLTFEFTIDTAMLNLTPGFWDYDWESSDGSGAFQAKLIQYNNEVEGEHIMFGRENANTPPLLPGWAEGIANSPLWNGVPISGHVEGLEAGGYPGMNMSNTVLGGQRLTAGQWIRISGVASLDMGHDNKPEFHPIYAIDVIQDWTQRSPFANLTGTWAGNEMSTFYVRQIGSRVWWLNLSRDQGRTYANVFVGTTGLENIQGTTRPVINGTWVDIPLGGHNGSGTLKLIGCPPGPCWTTAPIESYNSLTVYPAAPGYASSTLSKLYDKP